MVFLCAFQSGIKYRTRNPQRNQVWRKRLGRDDRQFIPYKSISFVAHDRKRVGRDVVIVNVGATRFEWKIAKDAEGFVNAVNQRIAG